MTVEHLRASLADRYRIEHELGAGGMATVYLAHDVKHDRKVALKVLRPELAAVIGAERFLAEIKTTANLQHPHILPLHDSGEVDGTVFYVMPFVEGESLRDRLTRETQLPVPDAVRIATEVAGALDYAHRHGVIHRDIKPENILLHDGQALVADFGIALAVSRSEGGTRLTETGMSLGTPHYMSPEQAMGERTLDARTDVYALGCVLYEMLAGEPPFTGPTAQAIVARVMTAEPTDISEIRKTVPEHVEATVHTALQKLPADRFPTAAAFAESLAGTLPTATLGSGRQARARRPPRPLVSWLGWGVGALGIAAGAWGWLRPSPRHVTRFVLGYPPGQTLNVVATGTHLAISRDGTALVYTGGDSTGSRLWIKQRDALAATALSGTEGAFDPFFSPDGRQVGFFTDRDGRNMKVVRLAGGPPLTVAGPPLGQSGATWATDGYIYFDADQQGLQRIRPDGSGRETVVPLDTTQREVGIAWPQVLPDNQVALVRLRHGDDTPSEYQILAAKIGTGERRIVVQAVTARYVPGHLLFVTADGTLQAAGFDERRLALTGPPMALATGVRIAGAYAGVDMALSGAGTLYYVGGPSGDASELEWVERDGTTRPVDPAWHESGEIRGVALSPAGDQAAVELSRAGSGTDIWIKHLPAGPLSRLTLNPTTDQRPSWSADGRSVLFISERSLPQAAYLRRADGTGQDSLLARADRNLSEVYESHDGRWLIARTSNAQDGAGDILAMQLGTDSALRPIIAGPALESNPTLSPDDRWLAYVSNASGRREVYVRPFPDVNRGVWQVSTDGGAEPRWAHSGTELFYREISSLNMMVVDVHATPGVFRAGTPRPLFHTDAAAGLYYPRYDVSPDDRRFLMVGAGGANTQPQLVRVENILQDLKRQRRP